MSTTYYDGDGDAIFTYESEELTLRDKFAMQAMSGMFAAFKHWPRSGEAKSVARHAYEAADAMMEERKARRLNV